MSFRTEVNHALTLFESIADSLEKLANPLVEVKVTPERVPCGVAILMYDSAGCLIMLKRQGSHGAGTWGAPGGWLDPHEHPEVAIKREVAEELGVTLLRAEFITYTYDVHPEGIENVCLWFVADPRDWMGNPQILEPHKATQLAHLSITEITELGQRGQLFVSTLNAITWANSE